QSYYDESGWRGTWDKEGGAALINQGIHGVDLITWMAGPIKRVYGHARHLRHRIEADDTTVAVCEYESGALGVIECTTSVTPRQASRGTRDPGRGRRAAVTSAAGMGRAARRAYAG